MRSVSRQYFYLYKQLIDSSVMSETYKKVDCIVLPHSTSAVLNNLSVKTKYARTEDIAVIHHDIICVVTTKSSSIGKSRCIMSAKFTNEKFIYVTQAAWCQLGYETVLVVTSTAGLQVFNQQGDECLYSYPCTDPSERKDKQFARGIAQFNSFYFCIGNSAGCIRMFGPPNLEEEITFMDRKHNHNYPISDLCTYKDNLASVDDEGYIILWRLEHEELIYKSSTPSKSNCTGLKYKKNWLITTYGSGHIRLYTIIKEPSNNMSMILSIEVMAHARAITGCDICQNNEYLLTVSEDGYAKIWLFTKEGNVYKIKHAHNIQVKDNMLMGGRFLASNGRKFCVTAYDSNLVTCYAA